MSDGSRLLNPTTPGGLLSQVQGLLTASESLVIQAITSGTYFVFNETPSGAQNGSNQTFTLARTPNPGTSVELKYNGQTLSQGDDYTLSVATITLLAVKPNSSIGDTLKANYIVSPV
jgi:hypothetical protein